MSGGNYGKRLWLRYSELADVKSFAILYDIHCNLLYESQKRLKGEERTKEVGKGGQN